MTSTDYDKIKHATWCPICGRNQNHCLHLFSRLGPTEEEAAKMRRGELKGVVRTTEK